MGLRGTYTKILKKISTLGSLAEKFRKNCAIVLPRRQFGKREKKLVVKPGE
jgi:hypothetical protein